MVANTVTPEGIGTVERLLTVKEVAALLQVSERTVWRLIDSGELPHVTVGLRSKRVRPEDLEDYVKRQVRTE